MLRVTLIGNLAQKEVFMVQLPRIKEDISLQYDDEENEKISTDTGEIYRIVHRFDKHSGYFTEVYFR